MFKLPTLFDGMGSVKETKSIDKYLETGRFEQYFENMSFIGKGAFGNVFKVRHILDKREYAVKKVRMHIAIGEDITKHKAYREIDSFKDLFHQNVLRYYGCWAEDLKYEDHCKTNRVVAKIQ